MKTLLLEIGSEEIPARFISKGLEALRGDLMKLLESRSIEYGSISEYATPRRLTLEVSDVAEKQKNITTKSVGPPKNIAYDDKGAPTKAAIGFAKTLNIDVNDLDIEETERGLYISATIEKKGRPAKDVLAEELPKLISSLQLPKTMRWGNSSLKYFRPIRWIMALLGNEVIPFELDGIESGNISYGHSFLAPEAVTIKDPASYLTSLAESGVIADIEERKNMISKGIAEIESANGCVVNKDADLLDTVTNLVEYPIPVIGKFEDKFITLPRELLITVMRTHQKYFSVEDGTGKMIPSFIVVSNTTADNNETVSRGAERVLRARLEDARFYFDEDRKKPLSDYIDELKKVTFQEKLGSVYDKSERISSIAAYIADIIGLDSNEKFTRAALLSKADLVTGVVGEFPELQGYMGMIYASNSGEDKEVASAIYEHYMPRFAGDILPTSETGIIISIADKIDSIVSFFSIGQIPTGSEDPFALRRQAIGIINILQTNDYPLTLDMLIERALNNLNAAKIDRQAVTGQIKRFFAQRLEGIYLSQGYGHDVIDASLSTDELNMSDLKQRIGIISEMKKMEEFPELLTAAKRVYNILAKFKPGEVDQNLLKEPAERDLYEANLKIYSGLSSDGFSGLFRLKDPINRFFDDILVMDKDPGIKDNRLALLGSVKKSFNSLCDFSKIS